jgi:hypothetical protein
METIATTSVQRQGTNKYTRSLTERERKREKREKLRDREKERNERKREK